MEDMIEMSLFLLSCPLGILKAVQQPLHWCTFLLSVVIIDYYIVFCRSAILYLHLRHHRITKGCHCGAQSVGSSYKQPLFSDGRVAAVRISSPFL